MTELGPLVQEGLGRAIMAVAPLVLAGLVGSVAAGWLAVRLGLRDPVMTGVLRGLAVLWALATTADALGTEARQLASETWGELAAVGRGEVLAEPERPAEPEVPAEPEESAEPGESAER